MKLKYIAFFPALLVLTTPAFALEATIAPRAEMRQEIKQERAENKEDRQQTRCQIITLRLDQTLKNYQTRKDIHVMEYKRLYDRLVALSSTLAAKGDDTTQLQVDLTTLNGMIIKLTTDYQAFINDLTSSKTQACTLTLDQVKTNLAAARAKLQDFRAQSKAIHDFIKNTVRKDLLTIRASIKPTPKPTSAE